jgi:thiol-disulfide isomerase/thioredoxin
LDSKRKVLIGLILFALFLILAGYAYSALSSYFKPEDKIKPGGKFAAPDFTVFDAHKKAVKLSDFAGKPIVLNFWASWCPPCRSEMPHFNEVYADVKGEVVFIMVDMTDKKRETQATGQEYVDKQGYDFPVYFDNEQQAAKAYNISSIPSTFLIDRSGNIVQVFKGSINKETLQGAVSQLLGRQI